MTTVQDKQLVDNVLKHATTHNRVVEEEVCWRQILQQRRQRGGSDSASDSEGTGRSSRHRVVNERRLSRSPISEASWKNSSKRATKAVSETSAKQQALDAYERELRHQAKREIELAASHKVSGVVVPNVTMNDRWGHDGWEALQNSSGRDPTPAYRPRIQPASYRLTPLVARTIENPMRTESLSSDLSHKSSVHRHKSKSKRRRKSKKRKRRRRDQDSDSDSLSSRSRSASSDVSRTRHSSSSSGGDSSSVNDKRSVKKKSRRKRRKEKKRRKRYSKRRGRKSRRSRKRYDSSSSRSCTDSRSRSTSRGGRSRSRTRRTSFSSQAGSRSRRSSCSCSCCSRSRSRTGSYSSRSRSRTRRSRSSSGRRSRSSTVTTFDSQRKAQSASRVSREHTSEVKSLPVEPKAATVRSGVAIQPSDCSTICLPSSDVDARVNGAESDTSQRRKQKKAMVLSPTPAPSQLAERTIVYNSPDVASPKKPASVKSPRSPAATKEPQGSSTMENGPLPRALARPGGANEPDDLYDPVLAVSGSPPQSTKSSGQYRSEHSDADACDIVDEESDIAEMDVSAQSASPPVAVSPSPSQRRVSIHEQPVDCPPPSSIPLPSPRPEEVHTFSLADIVPPPTPDKKRDQSESQRFPFTGVTDEVSLDSICIPPTPPRQEAVVEKRARSTTGSRHGSISSDRSASLIAVKSDASRIICPGDSDPAGREMDGQGPPQTGVKKKVKRRRRVDSSQISSDRSLSPTLAGKLRTGDSGRALEPYSGNLQGTDMPNGGQDTTGAFKQPVQANPHLPVSTENVVVKRRKRKHRAEQALDNVGASQSIPQVEERMAMAPSSAETTASLGKAVKQSRPDVATIHESLDRVEVPPVVEAVAFKQRKRKHGKQQFEESQQPASLTISPFKLPPRQLPVRKQEQEPEPEPIVLVRQVSPTDRPTKAKKKSRDRHRAVERKLQEPAPEASVITPREQVKRRSRRNRDTAPMGLPVPQSPVEAPFEKVSKWQEYGTVAHPSIVQTRPVLQPEVTSAVDRARPWSPAPADDSDSRMEVELPVTQIGPMSTGVDGAVRPQVPVASDTMKKEKKTKKGRKEKERRHSPVEPAVPPVEPPAVAVRSRSKRSKRRHHVLFTEALEAFTQQLLETKRALLPFRNLSQMAYEATGVSTTRKHRPQPSYTTAEAVVPAKQGSKKRHRKEPVVSGVEEHCRVSEPHVTEAEAPQRVDDRLTKGEKAVRRQSLQQTKPDLPVVQAQPDSEDSSTDATSDSEGSSSNSRTSGTGSSDSDSSSDSADEPTVAPACLPTSRKQQQNQPIPSHVNGTADVPRRPTPSKVMPSKQPPESRDYRKKATGKQQSVISEADSAHTVDLDQQTQQQSRPITAVHRQRVVHKRPSPSTSSTSSSSSDSSSSSSDGFSSLQSDEEISWKEPS